MSRKAKKPADPTIEQLQKELKRTRYQLRYRQTLRSTIKSLFTAVVVVAAIVMALPVLRMEGTSMQPTLARGDLLITLRGSDCNRGDIIVFNYGEKVLVKRVIALSGDVVDIKEDGTVLVNGTVQEEQYAVKGMSESTDVKFPYTVKQNCVFVLGDYRTESIDSRHTEIGDIAKEQIIGRIALRVWPLTEVELLTDVPWNGR